MCILREPFPHCSRMQSQQHGSSFHASGGWCARACRASNTQAAFRANYAAVLTLWCKWEWGGVRRSGSQLTAPARVFMGHIVAVEVDGCFSGWPPHS